MLEKGLAEYLEHDVEPECCGRRNLVTVAMVESCGISSSEGRIVDFADFLAGA